MDDTLKFILLVIIAMMFLGALSLAAIPVTRLAERGQREREAWKGFADANRLHFRPGDFFMGGMRMEGVYLGRNLRIETFDERKVTCTRVMLDASGSSFEEHAEIAKDIPVRPTPQEVFNLLIPDGPLSMSSVGVRIGAEAWGKPITYSELGVLGDADKLWHICDLLSDLADGYSAAVAMGGAVVPALQIMARESDLLDRVSIQILKDIAETTRGRLAYRAEHLICPRCLVRCGVHRADLPMQFDETYYGCRLCCQSREFIDCPQGVVAVLDSGWIDAQA